MAGTTNELAAYAPLYAKTLREDVIPFWLRHCPDREQGAYFTCLDRDGAVYDTTKFMWMQWRVVWMLSELYNKLERNAEWLALAANGSHFLRQHGRDDLGRYYFALARDGRPLIAPYSVFSECFAVMGCAAYHRASGDAGAREEALRAFRGYLAREDRPKGEWTKELPGGPAMRSLGFYMMKVNLQAVLEENLGLAEFRGDLLKTAEFVLGRFWNPELRVMFENVPEAGGFDLDSMAGRHLNPGHALEAMWFIMNTAAQAGRHDLVARAAEVALAELEFGWDREHGGLFYFMDALGKPHVELQWDMKLWWVHNEALLAVALAHRLTGRAEFATWFHRLHDWSWTHFPDPQYGEWFGYLNRRGEPTHCLKGGKWKGFFHLPRMLLLMPEFLG